MLPARKRRKLTSAWRRQMECWCSHQGMILSGTFPGLLKQSLCKAFKSSTFPFEIWYSTAKKKISDKYFTLHQISEITTLNQIPWNIYINVHEQKLLCDTINCLFHVPTYTIITQNFISITKTDHLLSISHLDNQKKKIRESLFLYTRLKHWTYFVHSLLVCHQILLPPQTF